MRWDGSIGTGVISWTSSRPPLRGSRSGRRPQSRSHRVAEARLPCGSAGTASSQLRGICWSGDCWRGRAPSRRPRHPPPCEHRGEVEAVKTLAVNAAAIGQQQTEAARRLTEVGIAQNDQVKRISAWSAIFVCPDPGQKRLRDELSRHAWAGMAFRLPIRLRADGFGVSESCSESCSSSSNEKSGSSIRGHVRQAQPFRRCAGSAGHVRTRKSGAWHRTKN